MLQMQIKRMCKGDGVQRHNSPQWIDARAHRYFGIPKDGSLGGTVAAVSDRFNELIQELPESLQGIARQCLNLTGKPEIEHLRLVDRQENLAAAGGPSRTKCIQLMKDVIAPELARLMVKKYGRDDAQHQAGP